MKQLITVMIVIKQAINITSRQNASIKYLFDKLKTTDTNMFLILNKK